MIMFFITAALLVALCVAWLLFGLFRQTSAGIDQEAVNITLARERRQQLDEALAEGAIDAQSHEAERRQLERDLAADLQEQTERQQQGRRGNLVVAVLIAIFIPIGAGALYLSLGNPSAIDETVSRNMAGEASSPPSLDELIPRLQARLAEAPEDVEGWRLLGRTWLSMNTFDKAQQALETALALDERHAPTLAQLSEAIAMQRGGELVGEPMGYLQRAIEIDPEHEHSRWLLAIGQQQAGDHEAALQGFDQLALRARDNPEALATIDQMRQRSLDALNSNDATVNESTTATPDSANASSDSLTEDIDSSRASPSDAPLTNDGEDGAISSPGTVASIDVEVQLDEIATDGVQPDQSVFVYARATEGPPMPLAVARLTVAQLPTTITLDDSLAMVPGMNLSGFSSVTVGARVSASGNPIARSGDWFGEVENVQTTDTPRLTVTIDRQTP